MKITITSANLDVTPAFKTHIEESIGSLDKFFSKFEPGEVQVKVAVSRENHHRNGDVYHSEINLTIPGGMIRARAEGADARMTVDEAKNKLKEEIVKHKEKKLNH